MNKVIKGHLLALFTIVIWGSTFIASKHLLKYYTPTYIMFTRFIIAYIVLWLIKPLYVKFSLKNELKYLFLALFGCTLYFLTENTALTYTLSSNVSIVVASAPILTVLISGIYMKKNLLTKNIIIGFFVAITGVILVVFNGTVILKLNPLGDFLSLMAALSWAIYTVFINNHAKNTDTVILTRKITFYGMVTSLPILFIQNKPYDFLAFVNFDVIFCYLFLGIIGSGICYITWNKAIAYLDAVTTNNYIYVNPFVTMITGAVFLKEPISSMAVIGAALIILGVICCNRKKHSANKVN